MRLEHISIFHLIKLFSSGSKKLRATLNTESHCEHKALHDYYCDAEKPYLSKNSIEGKIDNH